MPEENESDFTVYLRKRPDGTDKQGVMVNKSGLYSFGGGIQHISAGTMISLLMTDEEALATAKEKQDGK